VSGGGAAGRALPRPPVVALAALAAGFAVGSRVNFAAPVAALTLAVVWLAPRTERARTALLWVGPMLLTGAYWYLRNLLAVGNPLPAAKLGPLPRPEEPPLERTGRTVADYAADPGIWRDWFVPGLETALGGAWWAVLAAMAAGLALAIVRPPGRVVRAVALAGALAALAYLVTPQTAAGPPDRPFGFAINVRYLAPALALGFVLLGIAARRRAALANGGFAVLACSSPARPSRRCSPSRSATPPCASTSATPTPRRCCPTPRGRRSRSNRSTRGSAGSRTRGSASAAPRSASSSTRSTAATSRTRSSTSAGAGRTARTPRSRRARSGGARSPAAATTTS
jgi:hypothetical protein